MTLPYTLDQTRDREVAHVGMTGRPNKVWPGGWDTNDCVGYQTERVGLRTGHETLAQLEARPHLISIAAFRAHYRYPEVGSHALKAGMLVLSNWTGARVGGELEAEHMEWAYSVNHDAGSLVIIGANTGPAPGDPTPNGVWKKTRPIDSHIVGGILLPYRDPKPSRVRKAEVAAVAAYVNDHVKGDLPRTTAAGPGKDTGQEGKNYWRLVQTYGRQHHWYSSAYVIDGIPGPQTRTVEHAIYEIARKKK